MWTVKITKAKPLLCLPRLSVGGLIGNNTRVLWRVWNHKCVQCCACCDEFASSRFFPSSLWTYAKEWLRYSKFAPLRRIAVLCNKTAASWGQRAYVAEQLTETCINHICLPYDYSQVSSLVDELGCNALHYAFERRTLISNVCLSSEAQTPCSLLLD